MRTRRIGRLEVSVVGLGTVNFGGRLEETNATKLIDVALASGINFLDTADAYGETRSEEIIGKAIAGRRSSVVLATKFGYPFGQDHPGGGGTSYVRDCADGSLRRLKTDYLDLFIFHRPDPKTPINETLAALDDLVRVGKVREIGCSNFSLDQIRAANAVAEEGSARFTNVQNRFSLLHREPETDVLPECDRLGIGFVPYAPLMKGLLTGKYRSDDALPENAKITLLPAERRNEFLSEGNLATVDRLSKFSAHRGKSLLDLAVSWLLSHGAVSSVIAGASSPEQVRANVAASDWLLTPEELLEVDVLTNGSVKGA